MSNSLVEIYFILKGILDEKESLLILLVCILYLLNLNEINLVNDN